MTAPPLSRRPSLWSSHCSDLERSSHLTVQCSTRRSPFPQVSVLAPVPDVDHQLRAVLPEVACIATASIAAGIAGERPGHEVGPRPSGSKTKAARRSRTPRTQHAGDNNAPPTSMLAPRPCDAGPGIQHVSGITTWRCPRNPPGRPCNAIRSRSWVHCPPARARISTKRCADLHCVRHVDLRG